MTITTDPEKRRHHERQPAGLCKLTHTQTRILQALADGVPLSLMAEKLHLETTYDSIRNQAHLIRNRLGTTTNEHSVAVAFRNGWIT